MDTRIPAALALSTLLLGAVAGCGGGGGGDSPTPVRPLSNEFASPDREPIEPDPGVAGPVDSDPVEPGPTDPGPTDPGPIDPGPTDPDPVDPAPIEPEPIEPEPTDPGPSASGDDPGVVPLVIDRMGRPGISTVLIRTDDDEDAYNANGVPSTWSEEFTAPVLERLRLIDTLDGVEGNALLAAESLTALLVDDRLQIDTSVPVCDLYLAVEIGLGGCGGRTLERDVVDDTLRFLVAQDMPVSDLADGNDASLPGAWPFLAAPLPRGTN